MQHSIQFQGTTYQYFVFSPPSCATQPCPAMLLAHGSGGSGTDLVEMWKGFAGANGIVLVGPTLALGDSQQTANTESIAPQLFPAVVQDAKQWAQIDARRVYLFGYSAGGYTIYEAATRASTFFAAAAVFAAVITPDYDWIVQQAQRKTPVAIYLGDRDQFFTLAQGRATRDLLVANGFTVHYVELANQDHNISTAAAFVEQDTWSFMSQYSLP